VPAHEDITQIFYMDTAAGLGFEPTDYIETKKQMFLCHQSQIPWLEGHHKTEPTDMLETVAKFRRLQCGVSYAEAFRRLNVWGRPKVDKILP
jgi:hypothetical protein